MSSRVALGGLLVAGLLLRLATNHLLTVPTPVIDHDAFWYHATAQALADGRGYVGVLTGRPTAAWPPGYPALLSIPYRLFGADPRWAFLLNALAGTATCWLVGRLALALGSARAQLAATALAAIAPSQVLFSSLVMSETIFTTMMTALLLVAVGFVRSDTRPGSSAAWLAWGVAAGLASLVRAEAAVLLAVPVLALAFSRTPRRTVLAVACAVFAGSIAAQAPWLVRNARLFGQVVPVSTSFGRTMLIGHNPVADGGMNLWSPDPDADARDLASGDPARELAVDRRLLRSGVEFALANPGREAVLVLRRLHRMYRGDRVWGEWYEPAPASAVTPAVVEGLGRASNLFYWLLLAPALVALVRHARTREAGRLVIPATIAAWTLFFAVLLYGTERFHFPLVPLACVLAADTLTRRRGSSAPAS